MAKHDVKFSIPERDLGKADVEFAVKRDGKAFGRLKVSNGSVEWVQRDNTYGFVMGWSAFDKLMEANGKKRNA